MATDYAEMEREFLAGLEADTGHDLAGWMIRIDGRQLAHRNDIIDWLRSEGFLFSWASWLERIHHNGGRPIYAVTAAGSAPTVGPPAGNPEPPRRKAATAAPAAAAAGRLSAAATTIGFSSLAEPLADALARAKAYRPLAELVIREVCKVLPDVDVVPRQGHVAFARPTEFAALALSAKELRLGLALGEDAGETSLQPGRMTGSLARITHVLSLTDARQVTAALIEAVRAADRNVNGSI